MNVLLTATDELIHLGLQSREGSGAPHSADRLDGGQPGIFLVQRL
jgi:hypothetical protein